MLWGLLTYLRANILNSFDTRAGSDINVTLPGPAMCVLIMPGTKDMNFSNLVYPHHKVPWGRGGEGCRGKSA